MNRHTMKTPFGGYCVKNMADLGTMKAVQKLGTIEDIEEELGIDLITLFRALKEGIWYKNAYHEIYKVRCDLWDDRLSYNEKFNYKLKTNVGGFTLKDYGKTWALTKEELEK